jgi:RNA polymerase sigma-70 factor (ECF subfamily)
MGLRRAEEGAAVAAQAAVSAPTFSGMAAAAVATVPTSPMKPPPTTVAAPPRASLSGSGDGSSEALLLRRAATGDRAAFDALFAQHKDRVYSCLWHLLDGDDEQIEEAVGTVFLAAFRALPGFRNDAALSTYLYRIAINEATRRRKLRDRLRRHEAAVDPYDEVTAAAVSSAAALGGEGSGDAPGADGPEAAAVRAEENRLLAKAVRALPEPYRTPVVLRYLNDLPAVDVARILRRPAGTVRYQVSRGLDILRERLEGTWTR